MDGRWWVKDELEAPTDAELIGLEVWASGIVAALGVLCFVRGQPWSAIVAVCALWGVGAVVSEGCRRMGRRMGAVRALSVSCVALVGALTWLDGGLSSVFTAAYPVAILGAGVYGGSALAGALSILAVGDGALLWWAKSRMELPDAVFVADPTMGFIAQAALCVVAAFVLKKGLARIEAAAREAERGEAMARQAAEGFEMIFERSHAPMSLTAMDLSDGTRPIYESWELAVNKAFRDTTGFSSADAAEPGAMAGIWADPEERVAALAELAAHGTMAPRTATFWTARRQRQMEWQVEAEMFEWEGVGAALWTCVDLSELASLRRSLEASNKLLAQKVEARAATLAEARAELARKERFASLGEMVAGVAHEINTPIGNALLAASSLGEPLAALDRMASGDKISRQELVWAAERFKEAAALATGNLDKAVELIGSFKQLSADQAGQSRREYSLEATLLDAMRLMGPAFRRQKVAWRVECDEGAREARMDGYPGAWSQIAGIMANNALAHAFGGKPLAEEPEREWVVKATWDAQRDGARVEFSDNGAGVPTEHGAKVFDPFFTTKAGQGGTGLGLAIAWKLATETLGGQLALERPARGTRFALEAPRVAPSRDSSGTLAALGQHSPLAEGA